MEMSKANDWVTKVTNTANNNEGEKFTVKDITMIGKPELDGSELMQNFKIGGVEWVTYAYLGNDYTPSLADRKQAALDEVGMTLEYYLDGSLLEMATEVFGKVITWDTESQYDHHTGVVNTFPAKKQEK